MRIDPKSGEVVGYVPRSLCNFETMAAMFATSAGSSAALTAAAAGSSAVGAELVGLGAATASVGATGATTLAATGGGTGLMGLLSSAGSGLASLGWKDWLFGGVTAFSALSSIASGKATSAGLESQRRMEDFASKTEILKGRREALAAADSLNDQLEQNILKAGVNGITSEGSAGAAQRAAVDDANFELDMAGTNAEIRAGVRRANARGLATDADAAELSGYGQAAGTVANGFFRVARR